MKIHEDIQKIAHGSHIGQLVFVRFDTLKLKGQHPSTIEVKRLVFF